MNMICSRVSLETRSSAAGNLRLGTCVLPTLVELAQLVPQAEIELTMTDQFAPALMANAEILWFLATEVC